MKKGQNILRRILITDDKFIIWNGYILFELQELKRKYFWSKKRWKTLDSTSYNSGSSFFPKYNDWKYEYPEAEVINTSKNFIMEMKMEADPFKQQI